MKTTTVICILIAGCLAIGVVSASQMNNQETCNTAGIAALLEGGAVFGVGPAYADPGQASAAAAQICQASADAPKLYFQQDEPEGVFWWKPADGPVWNGAIIRNGGTIQAPSPGEYLWRAGKYAGFFTIDRTGSVVFIDVRGG